MLVSVCASVGGINMKTSCNVLIFSVECHTSGWVSGVFQGVFRGLQELP